MDKSTVLSSEFFEKLESNFADYAEKVAISYNGDERQITYKELNEISARVHGYLKAKDLKPDDFVMIKLPRGAEAGAVAIGVLRAGVAYTIVEEGYPQERVDFIYKDCSCKLCIDSASYNEILNTVPVYGFEKTDDHKAAFAIYTSGTTGTPKGVLLERSVLTESVNDFSFDGNSLFEDADRFAYSSPLSFSAFEIYLIPSVYAGSTFIIASTDILKNINRFREFITRNSISCFFLPPSLFKLFDDFPDSVTKLFSGGEAARNLFYNNVALYNTYGQSETARFVGTFQICKPYELTPVCNIHNKNSHLIILTEEGKEAKAGELGEICFNNYCFRGYINRPEETERAFRGGVYHTGDLGRVLEDGSIIVAGRADDMVKINGNRVEPAEIEEVVKNALGLSWAAAKVIEKNGHKSVCVYYIDEPKTSIEEAKKVIAAKLPAYMIPANYMQIVKMPLNANGKFSRRLLPDPQEQAGNYKNPQTDLEQKLFNLVSENVNTVSFGTDTNLVALGLDSIAIMKLCKDINEKLGKEISFADVMKNPTVLAIAETFEKGRKNAIAAYPVQKYYPLTENQRGIYINWEIDTETTQYNIPFYYSFRSCDAQKLAEAVRKAVSNHCNLKACLEMVDGEPMLKRCDDAKVIVSEYLLETKPDSDFFKKLVKPFDLFNEPLYRINVYTYGSSAWLFMDFHHIVFDGLSSQLLMNDIVSAYNGKELTSEKINAYDFALYQKDFEQSEEYKSAEKYFDEILGDAEPARFTAYSKPDGKNYGKLTKRFSSADIFDYCRRNGVTASSFMHAAFSETLHRITRENEFLYTTVSNGRSADNALQNCTGMFVQTLPVVLRTNTTPFGKGGLGGFGPANNANGANSVNSSDSAQTHAEQRVSDYIHSVHEQLQKSFENECYPYTKFSERHKINTEITFLYQGGILGNSALTDGNSIEIFTLDPDKPVFPVNMLVYPVGDEFEVRLEYDGMKYSSHDMQILAEAVVNAAISMISAEHVKDISLVSDEQKEQIIKLSAGEKLEYDRTQTWIDLFKKQVKAHSDKLAVADSVSSMTYSELDIQSDKVAAWLIDNGVKEDEFVAVKMSRVKEFITAIIGIQKAGAAYVPITVEYPEERIAYMLEDSEAGIVITEQTISDILAGDSRLKDGYRAAPERTAYMIYTSGSTGKPKGALLHQRGLLNFTYSLIGKYEMTAEDRISSYRAFSFDAMIADIYPTLCCGASMFIMPEEIRKDPDAIYDFLIRNDITGGGYTTSIAGLLIKNYNLKQRFIACGGEALKDVCSDKVVIYNAYGPTECTDDITIYRLEKGRHYDSVPIGRPVFNSYCFIVDQFGNLVPRGIAGELCYAGPQTGYGYWHLDEKTREVFEDCRYVDGYRMYHTGDLARYDEDGEIAYIGRIDFQVKLRGYRIEPGEIEARASSFNGIQMVAAAVKQEHLCFYYSTADGKVLDKNAIREYLAGSLAEYMVPDVYMHLEEMPMTPNGKIDRKKLPEPEIEAAEIVAPADETEQKLFDIASEMLKTDKFGVTTSLISMGMSSLMSMRFAAAVQKQMNVKISVADIMKHQTIRLIAENLGAESTVTAIKAYPKQELYPLTENQRGLYIDWEMHKNTTQYNIPTVLKFTDKTAEGLEKAVRTAFAAHGYLKTRLVQTAEDVMQKPCDEETEILVQKLDKEPDTAFFQSRVRPFDLINERLYRVEIYSAPKAVYLFMDIHHIIYDGLSSSVLMNDILSAYDGKPVEAEKITACDFALHEKEILAGEAFTRAEIRFDSLVGEAASVNYPASAKPDGKATGTVTASVAADIVDSFCRKNSVTANSFMQAAFAETLHRITREENPLYVTISNGRFDGAALERSMGMFVKTLPVVLQTNTTPFGKGGQGGFGPANNANHANGSDSAQTHGEQKVSDYVQTMHRQLQESYASDFYPYTRIVERYGIHAGIMFVYQGGLYDGANVANDGIENIPLQLDTVKFPITFTVYPHNGEYVISVEYDGMKYNNQDMRILAEAVSNAAKNMTSTECVKDVSLVSEEQETDIIAASAGEKLEYDRTQTWVDMFRQQAAEHPDTVAVVDSVSSITYRELDKQSDSVAAYLLNKGVKVNDFVAVKMGRVKEFITAVLGINKTGAAYIPVDSDYPEERIGFMLEDSSAKAVVTEAVATEALQKYKNAESVNNSTTDGLAYMIYTSGTTGKPKGVMILHRGLRAFIAWNNAEFAQCHGTSHLVHASFSFDASVFDMLCPLAAGSTVHILGEELRRDLAGVNDYITANNITGMLVNTSVGMELLSSFEPGLKYIMLGGEKMLPVRKTGVKVYNAYGPTEFTAASTFYPVNHTEKDVPIGRPVPNSYGVVCDKYGHLLPQGIAGELCFAGEQTGAGYWNRPELTAEKFAPIAALGSQPVYRTGDLARYNEEGNLEYLGRIDFQVKLRGFRIELGEIDNVASQFNGIKQVIAQVRKLGAADSLVLYYSADKQIDKDELKSFMAKSLTDYMVPTVFMQLGEMPMTPNGKIDRKKLPEPEIEVEETVAPETATEKKLFAVATEILGFNKFGVTTSLISAGMTSLAAMRFSAAAKQKAGLKVKVADIMKLQTIRAISANMEKGEDSGVALKAYEKRELYPITENQRGIYVDWEMNRDTTQYNIPSVYRFEDKDAEKLADAVRKTVDAHSYLKTRFVNENGDIMQKPMWEEPAEVTVQTLDSEPDSAFFQKLVKPFNLFEDRLYRIATYKAPKASYLFMDIHHTVFDGLSFDVILRDILAAYDGKVPEPEKLTAFDFALYEKEVAASEIFNKAEAYFDKITGDSNTAIYPDVKEADGIKNGKVAVKIPMEAIDSFCSENGVTVNAYMHAAFAETLHRFTREENPLYLTISNGRSDAEALQNTVGMFVKTLPVVMQTEGLKHGDETVAAYVKRMYLHLQDLYAYDFYPYTRIVEKSRIHAEIMFVYQGGIEGYSSKDVNCIQLNLDTGKFPVNVNVYPEGGKYCLIVDYDGMRYEHGNMRQFAEAIAAVAENMASEKVVKDIRLLGKDEAERVLKLSAGEKLEYDRTQTWIDLFKKQVAAYPEKLAVVDDTSSLTYAELNRQSDSVAAYLMNKGVKPNDFVALKMDRVKEFVVAVLGIHKAGAAYVPIDIHYPQERIDYILSNSMARFTITEKAVAEAVEQNPDAKPVCLAKPDNYAYMIYTSGSTGLPKGALLHQRGLMNFTVATIKLNELTKDDRISCYRSFSFDAHIEDVFPVLATGASVHIMPESIRKDLDSMYKFLMEHQITGGGYTTSIAKLMLTGYDLKQRFITCGGEALTNVISDKVQILNVYGPTECTDHISVMKLEKNRNYSTIPIGKPMANGYCFIVDKYGSLVPAGAAGELCYAGPQVGYGYWHLDEKTKAVFGDCPFVKGIRMYHTGDLARYNKEGNIEYLGRIDFQVKLRGFRIELGEVESRASQYKGVKQVIALVKNVGTTQNLCLYFTAETEVDKEALRSFMAETLTEYMVPTVFMQLDKMPMTPNGKIDRKKLPEPKMDRKAGREPSTELESRLCAIFAEILGVDKVYADESFFNIGGTSLSAMKVVMKSMNSGIKFVYSNIFDNPSPEALAKFIENNSAANSASEHNSNEVSAPEEESFADALKYNSMEHLEDITRSDIGNVLVTGANGFLGIHIVKKLIDSGCPTVYCLIRSGKNMTAETRLDMMFMYYFDETYLELIGNRIKIVNGDITDKNLEETLKDLDYDTIINCAAIVKHFANDDRLDRVNFHGVENLIEICCRQNKKLVQVSTTSVAGESVSNCVPQGFLMHENQHSFGQNLDNKYMRTKWQAEKAILGAVQNRGLRGKIIRVGNLMSRASDGEFQANFRSNNFMNKLRAYNTIGYLPMANIITPTEFSPIDSTAEAVITLAGTPDKFTVFHAKNNHLVDMANVIDAMNACGLKIQVVKQSEFQKHFEEVMHDEKRNASISSLIAYLGNNSDRRIVISNNTFTIAALHLLGFRWPIITEEYIEKAIKALKSMDFFE